MNIAVIGLGLIGGSICKALKKFTNHTVYGMDIDKNVCELALKSNSINYIIDNKELNIIDVCFICLYPKICVNFVLENISAFKKGCIITDVCGIKQYIQNNIEKQVFENGLFYVGGHPMAGTENSGFMYSDYKILSGASYILTKSDLTDNKALNTVKEIINSLGCKIIFSDALSHDKVIAYTSQLAHIVSSSYVKSPSIDMEKGFTGGSFQDMTRVAFLSEKMWTDLFLLNKDNLLCEIDILIKNLSDFRNAIYKDDKQQMLDLLKQGKELKSNHLK